MPTLDFTLYPCVGSASFRFKVATLRLFLKGQREKLSRCAFDKVGHPPHLSPWSFT